MCQIYLMFTYIICSYNWSVLDLVHWDLCIVSATQGSCFPKFVVPSNLRYEKIHWEARYVEGKSCLSKCKMFFSFKNCRVKLNVKFFVPPLHAGNMRNAVVAHAPLAAPLPNSNNPGNLNQNTSTSSEQHNTLTQQHSSNSMHPNVPDIGSSRWRMERSWQLWQTSPLWLPFRQHLPRHFRIFRNLAAKHEASENTLEYSIEYI